jgi:subtilisin-like proprotein convertase family protein
MFRRSIHPATRRTGARAAALLALVTSAALVAGVTADVAAAKSGGQSRGHHGVTAKTLPSKVFSFTGANTGAIPDATTNTGACGTATNAGTRDVTFTVSGTTAPLSNVSVSVSLTHAWGSDVALTLIAPNAVQSSVMSRPNAPSAVHCGNGNDWNGNYTFNDQATLNFWTAQAAGIPASGSYRAAGAFSSSPITLSAPFLPLANVNGTWILRVQDMGVGDVGTISAATLDITAKDSAPCAAATAKTAAAQAVLGAAGNKASSAATSLQKAKAKLKSAKRSGNPAKIKKAKKRVKRAKGIKKDADAAVASAQAATAAALAAQAAVC